MSFLGNGLILNDFSGIVILLNGFLANDFQLFGFSGKFPDNWRSVIYVSRDCGKTPFFKVEP